MAVVASLWCRPAVAVDDEQEGRRQFKRGQELLRIGDYRAAAQAFEAGYAAAPRAGFLLNIGNCYRKLGELGKARQYYWRFLDAVPRDHPSRAEVIEYLRAMEQIEADGVSVDGAVRPPATLPPRSAALAIAAPASAAPELVLLERTPPPPGRGGAAIARRWWFWTLIGGALTAGAAVALAEWPGQAACGASLGCARE